MSATDLPEEDAAAADHAYFQAVESLFISLRGSPLLLSPADWQVAKGWRREGVPLRLVRSTLEELFARRDREGKGKVQSLRYCKSAVQRAWKQEQELVQAQAPAPQITAKPHTQLHKLAQRLRQIGADPDSELNRALAPALDVETWAQRVEVLEGDPQRVEAALCTLDSELLSACRERLSEDAKSSLEQQLHKSLDNLRSRLPQEELEATRLRLAEQLLRRHLDLPLLSLFSVEHDGAGASGASETSVTG